MTQSAGKQVISKLNSFLLRQSFSISRGLDGEGYQKIIDTIISDAKSIGICVELNSETGFYNLTTDSRGFDQDAESAPMKILSRYIANFQNDVDTAIDDSEDKLAAMKTRKTENKYEIEYLEHQIEIEKEKLAVLEDIDRKISSIMFQRNF
ncbi:MAG TPA: hypothetical protein VL443_08085 [Cyclobacteriaceae bacterium]|nr:hypothetical protein [Cyclobacteriaceae bacterium]